MRGDSELKKMTILLRDTNFRHYFALSKIRIIRLPASRRERHGTTTDYEILLNGDFFVFMSKIEMAGMVTYIAKIMDRDGSIMDNTVETFLSAHTEAGNWWKDCFSTTITMLMANIDNHIEYLNQRLDHDDCKNELEQIWRMRLGL